MNFNIYFAFALIVAILIVPDSSDAQGRSHAGPRVSGPPSSQIDQLVKFVQSQRLQGCLARVICELSANPNALGQEGIKFGSSLLSMQRTGTNNPIAAQFRAASSVGSHARNPAQCSKKFSNCAMSSSDIVRMGNNMLKPTAF